MAAIEFPKLNSMPSRIASSNSSRPRARRPAVGFWLVLGLVLGLRHGLVEPELRAQPPPGIGMELLVAQDPTLTGSGLRVAQIEGGWPVWEVSSGTQPAAVFEYYGSNGASAMFPNNMGEESSHADAVGSLFYGGIGVAPGIGKVDNYDANYFQNVLLANNQQISATLVNQSFIDLFTNPQDAVALNSDYDAYATEYQALFVSGAGNSGTVAPPASAYNGIGVGAWGGSSATGPTSDNGRCKPDITAPAAVTSFSTPQVSGAAAILWQAGGRGDGGAGTGALATDWRTVKALLLNGAVKPADWMNSTTNPLDFRYGAGILNVFNSWRQLAAGRITSSAQTSVGSGAAHAPPPGAIGGAQLVGWDNTSVAVQPGGSGLNHYYFQVPANGAAPWTLSATLVWNKDGAGGTLNNLNFFLYNIASGALVASSQSMVDNVQHIHVTGLAPGQYDLQVMNLGSGGLFPSFGSEDYALAVSFTSGWLSIAQTAGELQLVWPVYPAGLVPQATGALGPGMNWTNLTARTMVTNNQNNLDVNGLGSTMFFRLASP